jgi:hypothetical protein
VCRSENGESGRRKTRRARNRKRKGEIKTETEMKGGRRWFLFYILGLTERDENLKQ